MTAGRPAPLVVTLELAPDDQRRFDDLRRAHFPADRNHLAAHVTLFHQLPGEQLPAVLEAVRDAARRDPFELDVTGPRLLGRGVAIDLRSPEAAAVHRELAAAYDPWLTRQDRQRFTPHVTVQNKVEPERARGLHEQLQVDGPRGRVRAAGLAVWRYLGGPWEPVATSGFGAPLDAAPGPSGGG